MYMHVDRHYYYLVLQEIDQYFIPQTWWHVLYCGFTHLRQWSNSGQLTHFHHTIVQTGSYPSLSGSLMLYISLLDV